MATKDFEQLLLEAVDEALASLGDSAKEAIYFHLEDKFEISKDEIPRNLEVFLKGLDEIFGVGARFLEILMMKELYKRIGQPFEWEEGREFMFTEYVVAAKRSFPETAKKG